MRLIETLTDKVLERPLILQFMRLLLSYFSRCFDDVFLVSGRDDVVVEAPLATLSADFAVDRGPPVAPRAFVEGWQL